jgi:hypothetical protein
LVELVHLLPLRSSLAIHHLFGIRISTRNHLIFVGQVKYFLFQNLPMRRKNDILWKGIIEEVFDDLLRFIFPEADKVFDIGRGFEKESRCDPGLFE